MFKFAIKNLLTKKIQAILIIISIMISAGVATLSYNISKQVNEQIVDNAQYYGVVVGPAGSKTQLIMNTMYFTDEVLGTIPYSLVDTLQHDTRVKAVVPYAMADSYHGYDIVGTNKYFLNDKEVNGELFNDADDYTIVLGANVAKTCGVNIGDAIYTSHSQAEEHTTPFIVTGILKKTNSMYDNILFTSIKSIWAIHEEEHEEEEEHEHEHEFELDNMVCAILVQTQNPIQAALIAEEYNNKTITIDSTVYSLQAVEPMAVVRNILNENSQTEYIVYALCAVILAMNLVVISIITILNMYNSSKEIKLMRLIGISMNKINLVYLIENSLLGIFSCLLAFGISRIGLIVMTDYCLSMGASLDVNKFYIVELVILIGVFAISVIPTIIWTKIISKKDGLE